MENYVKGFCDSDQKRYNGFEVNPMDYSAIVLAAGSGRRTGLQYNKMFYKIDDLTVYEKTMNVFLNDSRCRQIVVVTKPEERDDFSQLIDDDRIVFTAGGKERQDSVFNGLKCVTEDYVLIHDGARPFLKKAVVDRILDGLAVHDAIIPMVRCKDTIKRVIGGKIVETLKREELYQAQTPQSFKTSLIYSAYDYVISHDIAVTDDASCVEVMGKDVYIAEGDYDNIKITTKEDLR